MKYAVIGNGSMGKRRIGHLLTLKANSVFGYDIRLDRRKEVEEKFKIKTVKSVKELVENKPDTIFICTPPANHIFYLKLAAKEKWNFMCENPVWHRPKGLEEIAQQVRKNKKIANISCNMRFQESIKRLKKIVREKVIGNVLTGIIDIGEWLPDWHPWEPYTDYYPSHKSQGGGLDMICDLDWLIDFFGKVEKSVCIADKKSNLRIDTYDITSMSFKFLKGPIIHFHADMIQRSYSHDVKLVGDKGTAIWRCADRAVYLYTAVSKKWKIFKEIDRRLGKTWVEKMYLDDTKHFLKCIKGKTKPLNSVENNAYCLKIVLDTLKSNKKGKFIYFK